MFYLLLTIMIIDWYIVDSRSKLENDLCSWLSMRISFALRVWKIRKKRLFTLKSTVPSTWNNRLLRKEANCVCSWNNRKWQEIIVYSGDGLVYHQSKWNGRLLSEAIIQNIFRAILQIMSKIICEETLRLIAFE